MRVPFAHKLLFIMGSGLVLGFGGGCGKKSSHNNNVSALSNINDSFVVKETSEKIKTGSAPTALSEQSSYYIGINKQALDKEFLFQGSMITQTPIAKFEGLKSRIVAFKTQGDKVYLLEATKGHTVSDSMPQTLVLAEFPKMAEDTNFIYFDFSSGFNRIYKTGDWHGQDFEGGQYLDTWTTVPMSVSYIDKAYFHENALIVKQIGQMLSAGTEPAPVQTNAPVALVYYLKPYQENKDFTPFRARKEDFDQFGYFEVAPQLQTKGPEVIYASKFADNRTITYGISHNTPAEYRSAIRDGVLYWNKAFGREVMKVVDLPEGVAAPDYQNNIIQWVDWDNAGFAYADAQMDPRTGEILHAQIFMTSAFAFGGKNRARQILDKLKEPIANPITVGPNNHVSIPDNFMKDYIKSKRAKPVTAMGLAGFAKPHLCWNESGEHLVDSLETLLSHSETLDDSTMLKIAQDYVREVVAHEVGHTLGLRHNFAGSLAANFTQEEKGDLYKQYILDGHTPSNVVSSSSVMEYQRFEESTMTGDQLANSPAPLEYDLKAIQHLYQNKSFAPEEVPLFCTDTHMGQYIDCNVFDSGNSLVDYWIWQRKSTLASLPYMLIENYITAKSPYPGYDASPLKKVTPHFAESSLALLMPTLSMITSLQDSTKFISVRRRFGQFNYLNEYEVIEKEEDYLTSEIAKHKAFDELLSDPESLQTNELMQEFSDLLDNPNYSSGIGPGGQYYEFTAEDKAIMRQQAYMFFTYLQYTFAPIELMMLTQTSKMQSSSLGQQVLDKYYVLAQKFVMSMDHFQEFAIVRNGVEEKVNLPIYRYPTSMRIQAASLLANRWANPIWANFESTTLKNQLLGELNSSFKTDITLVNPGDYGNMELRRWVNDNKKVLDSFSLVLAP